MKNYIIRTLMVALPEESITESIVITLPNNSIPIGIEVRPASFPEGLFLHHLIPCDENGNPIEEVIPINIYEIAWEKLGQVYGEQQNQEGLDGMDAVFKGVELEMEGEVGARKDGEKT